MVSVSPVRAMVRVGGMSEAVPFESARPTPELTSALRLSAAASRQTDRLRAAAHRVAGDDVLAHGVFEKALRRDDLHAARSHVRAIDNTAHAAEMVEVTVRIDHGDHGLVAQRAPRQRKRGARHFHAGERIDDDEPGIADDDGHVGMSKPRT